MNDDLKKNQVPLAKENLQPKNAMGYRRIVTLAKFNELVYQLLFVRPISHTQTTVNILRLQTLRSSSEMRDLVNQLAFESLKFFYNQPLLKIKKKICIFGNKIFHSASEKCETLVACTPSEHFIGSESLNTCANIYSHKPNCSFVFP